MPRKSYSWEKGPRPRRRRGLWKWLLLLPLLLLVAGGAVAAFLLWSVRTEFMALAGQYDLGRLERMESASIIYDRKGGLMGKIFIQNRDPVPYDKISAQLVNAVVAAEDQRFWEHDGVDYAGIVRAAQANWTAGRIRQGASTVTQQLARNTFELKERTYRRKLLEMALALRIEENFPKEKIMEMYLNRVYFGGGLYGAEAAARGYFGVPAEDLTASQAATLAGLLKSPNSLSPWTNPEAAKANRDVVLKQMHDLRFLDAAAYRQALADPLTVRERPDPVRQSYALDYVRQQAIASLGFDRAMNGGFRIYTTIDPGMQKAAEESLQRRSAEVEKRPGYANETFEEFQREFAANPPKPGASNTRPPAYLQGAVLALDNRTGGILVMVGGRNFRHSEYNRSIQGRRPLGTAFAPLLYAAAFEKGIFPGVVVQDWALDNRLVGVGGAAGVLGEWGVERADNEYEGEITAREAFVRGKNAAMVRVGFKTGLEDVGRLTKKAGIASPLRPFANAYLGTSEFTLEETTLAYTMFPGAGTRPERTHIIDRIEDADGEVIYRREEKRQDVVTDATAWQVHSLMSESLNRGTGDKAMTDLGLAVAGAAGKTGTAYGFTDVWFVGYNDRLTCGVWMGFDRPKQIFRGAFGRDLALPVWVDVMNASRDAFPSAPLKAPVTVEQVEVCRVSGELATDKCVETVRRPDGSDVTGSTVYTEYARIGKAPSVPCPVHAGGPKSFVKEFSEEEWPRAAVAVDLSKVRPVDVSSLPVVGAADPYESVSPASMAVMAAEVPVAVAEAVGPAALPAGDNAAPSGAAVPEVRPAQAAGISAAVQTERPAMDLPPPPPIRF
jgi:membrane peptidoglycan carboxypeptidase